MKAKIFLLIILLFSSIVNAQWVGKFTNFGNNKSVYSLVYYNGYVFAATGSYGVHYTSSFGDDWNSELTYQTIDGTIWCMILNQNRFYAAVKDSGVYVSADGFTWQRTALGNKDVHSIAANGNTVYAGTWGRGIYKSTNYGATWDSSGMIGMDVDAILISGTYVFASAYQSGSGKGIYISTNGGTSWTQSSLNNKYVKAIVAVGSNIFAGTYNTSPSGVYISTNSGATWTITALNNKLLNTLYVYDSKLFAGTYNGGIYYSSNNGTTWKDKNEGFPQTSLPSVYSFLVVPPYIFEGNYGWSVWRRPYAETIGIKKISNEVPSDFSLWQNYPNPFNPSTKIKFALKIGAEVELIIYDETGKEIEKLIDNVNLKSRVLRNGF
jgi:hypothetical protein